MKKVFNNKKLVILLVAFFIIVFANTFLCYLVSYYSMNNSKGLYILIPFIVALSIASAFLLIIFLRKFSDFVNIILLVGLTIFIVAVLDTVLFKILSITSTEDMFLKTGFKSIVILFSYYAIMLLISILPIKKKKEAKVLEKQKI